LDRDRCVVADGTGHLTAVNPLVIGTGFYPLSADRQPAHVELWTLEEDEPEFLALVALPGVCVDAITWSGGADMLACATGMRSHSLGFIAQIVASTMRPVSFSECARVEKECHSLIWRYIACRLS
jgi:hypothetical protein